MNVMVVGKKVYPKLLHLMLDTNKQFKEFL